MVFNSNEKCRTMHIFVVFQQCFLLNIQYYSIASISTIQSMVGNLASKDCVLTIILLLWGTWLEEIVSSLLSRCCWELG